MDEINRKYAEINELKAMLVNTDYTLSKAMEGYAVSDDVLQQRHDARVQINVLEIEIAEMERVVSELEDEQDLLMPTFSTEIGDGVVNVYADETLIGVVSTSKLQPTNKRVTSVEEVTEEVITALNEKGIVP